MTTPTDQQYGEQAQRIRIAEALGWRELHTEWHDAGPSGYEVLHGKVPAWMGDWRSPHVPSYFTDANAAESICNYLRSTGAIVRITSLNEKEWAVFIERRGKYAAMIGEGTTLAKAICRAFIQWLDAQK